MIPINLSQTLFWLVMPKYKSTRHVSYKGYSLSDLAKCHDCQQTFPRNVMTRAANGTALYCREHSALAPSHLQRIEKRACVQCGNVWAARLMAPVPPPQPETRLHWYCPHCLPKDTPVVFGENPHLHPLYGRYLAGRQRAETRTGNCISKKCKSITSFFAIDPAAGSTAQAGPSATSAPSGNTPDISGAHTPRTARTGPGIMRAWLNTRRTETSPRT